MFIFNYGSVWFLILFEISIDLRTLEYTSSSSWVISQKSILNFVGYFWMHKTITESGLFDDNKVLSEQLACCLIEWNFRENYCLGCMWTERYLHFSFLSAGTRISFEVLFTPPLVERLLKLLSASATTYTMTQSNSTPKWCNAHLLKIKCN